MSKKQRGSLGKTGEKKKYNRWKKKRQRGTIWQIRKDRIDCTGMQNRQRESTDDIEDYR